MIFSTIIALYNNAPYLENCIRSLYLQNLQEEDFEVIIVDDGSTDGGGEMAERLAQKFSNLKVIHQTRSFSGIARNTGVDAAKGDYIHFVDADDHVMPGAYRFLQEKALTEHPDLVYFSYGENSYAEDSIVEGEITYVGTIRDYIRGHHVRPTVWNKLFKRNYLLKSGVRFLGLRTRQDIVFNWDLLRHDGTMVVSNAKLYSYTLNYSGATRKREVKHMKSTVENLIFACEKLKEFSGDYQNLLPVIRVADYNYHVLFNRILCTPYTNKEIRIIFDQCAKIGTNHLINSKLNRVVNFLYHHPELYICFLNLIAKLYFSRYSFSQNQADFLHERLKI